MSPPTRGPILAPMSATATATAAPVAPKHGSDTVTAGIRVRVEPSFLPQQSNPKQGKWLFGYRVSIVNESETRVRLRNRHWTIVDADGKRHEVNGPGVVGQFPTLEPGQRFEYPSFCPLETSWGTMEGFYRMERDDGTAFDVQIARFYLVGAAG